MSHESKKIRDSSIELLKIFAVFIIIINHVVQTLTSKNPEIAYSGYVVNISVATTNVQNIILLIFRHFGVWGNSLFFICSAWFLLKSKSCKKKKMFFMLIEIWTISIIIMVMSYVLLHGRISTKILINSIFPTTFANNWYMTCYLLFYPIHPILNNIIEKMNQQQLFRSALVLVILYIFLDFIKSDLFFSSPLILWIAIYFSMAYMQIYLTSLTKSISKNILLLFVSTIGFIVLIILTEIVGLHIPVLSGQMMRWVNNCNPFILAISIAMFNIARNIHFKSKFINYIASFSLLIYIIHENIIIRTYFRPAMWNYIYRNYGYNHIVGWVFILSAIIFLFSILFAILYASTIQMIVHNASNKLYEILKEQYIIFERRHIR